MSCFFAEQLLTQLALLWCWKETATYKNQVYCRIVSMRKWQLQLPVFHAARAGNSVVHKLMDAMSSCCGVPG